MKIGVLMGGGTSEHEISLLTGKAVADALSAAGHTVRSIVLGSATELIDALHADLPELVFVALHGGAGEDGRVQAVLELMGLPYVGSRPGPCAVAMDKVWTKQIARGAGVPCTAEAVFEPSDPVEAILTAGEQLGPATVFKPVGEGSAVGVHLCADAAELRAAVAGEGARTGRWMLEPFVAGRELTVGVVRDVACPVIEIRPRDGFYDYANKYTAGRTEYFCPADLPADLAARVSDDALRLYHALRLRDMARIDFRLDPERGHFLLEANTIPGMTATSLLPMGAKGLGMGFGELCLKLVEGAVGR